MANQGRKGHVCIEEESLEEAVGAYPGVRHHEDGPGHISNIFLQNK